MGVVSLLKIPSFVKNFVQKTMEATYDSASGNITLFRNENCTVDKCPEQNTYQRVLENSKLPNVVPTTFAFDDDEDNDDNVYTLTNESNKRQNDIHIVELEESKYIEHCSGDSDSKLNKKLPYFLSFTNGDSEGEDENDEDLYHIFSTDNENVDKTDGYDDVDEIVNKIIAIKRTINPIICMQYLTLLMGYFRVNTLKAISNLLDLESAIQDLVIINLNEDEEKYDTFFQETQTYHRNSEQEGSLQEIRDIATPNDTIILMDNGDKMDKRNGIYLVSQPQQQQQQNKDIEDGDICTLLLQVSASVVTSAAVLIAKQIRKYLKKHNNRKREEKKKATTSNPDHLKLSKQEGKGKFLWDKINDVF